MSTFVLIAGGGRTGTELAHLLSAQKFKICIIENRPAILSRLHHELPTEVIYEGNAIDLEVLERAGIRNAQVLAACMADDAENLTCCYVARKRFGVPRTIARINNPRNAWLFDKAFHVDVALNHSDVMARLIAEQMSLGDMITLLKLRRGDYSLVEEKIPVGAPAVGKALKDLHLPENVVIAAIIRDGQIVLPRGQSELLAGDEVLAVTDPIGASLLANLFTSSL